MTITPQIVPLNKLNSGTTGRIVAVKAAGKLLQRLLSMGFTRGYEIKVVKRAPLGDPIQFKVRGSTVSLRGSEAAQVLVDNISISSYSQE